jgi:4-oxalocrotonate tautomerase
MPIVDIKVMKGALSDEQKRELVNKVGEAVLAVEGEAMRPYLMVGVSELTPPCVVAGRTIPAPR